MKSRIACLLFLTAPVFAAAATAAEPVTGKSPTPAIQAQPARAHRFFASASLTKEQKNSPTASDFGLFEQTADGKWSPFGPRINCSGLTAAPGNPSVMLVPGGDGIVRSDDAGKSWRQVTGWEVADVRSIVFDRENPRLAYAATAWGPVRSSDGGDSWQPAAQGLGKLYCQTIVADPRHSGRVVLGTEDGIYVSTDAARSWKRVPSPATTILRLARSEADPSLLLAGTLAQGAWISRDNGATWAAIAAAPAPANYYAAALSPHDSSVLAVGGWGVGVRVSGDGGTTWADRSAGLPVKNVLVLAFDPDFQNRLWAATFEEGSYYSDDLGRTWKNGGLYGANGTDYIFIPRH